MDDEKKLRICIDDIDAETIRTKCLASVLPSSTRHCKNTRKYFIRFGFTIDNKIISELKYFFPTSWEQAVRTHPVDKLLEQHCYKSVAGLLQLVRFYVCNLRAWEQEYSLSVRFTCTYIGK